MNNTPKVAAAIAFLSCFHLSAVHGAQYSSGRRSAGPLVPTLALPAIPAAPVFSIRDHAAVVSGMSPAQAVLGALGGEFSAASEEKRGGVEAGVRLGEVFDGARAPVAELMGFDAGGGAALGRLDGGSEGKRGADDGRLGRLYPRVVLILDTLSGPATERLVKHIEALVDHGVKVVFVTARPDKGENSADSILVAQLKPRTANPVVIVSYNGARITARSSRAENPKPLIDDQQGISPSVVASLRKINAAVKAKFALRSAPSEFGIPSAEEPHIYGIELPKSADLAAVVSFYNRALGAAGYRYKVEGVESPEGKQYLFTQSTALKLNTGRVFNALYAQYPELRDTLKREQVLVLADSTKAAGFLRSLSHEESVAGKGFYIHGVNDGASLETALGAVLGVNALDKVSVMRSQLRSYTSWLEARIKYGASRGGGGGYVSSANASSYRDLGFYRGILLYDLMGRLYHLMRKGQYAEASPEAAETLLTRMWYAPLANGVRISPELEAARHSGRWKALQRGYLETTKVWLRNYYHRNFKDYPNGVSEKVVGTMMNLSRDSKNSITLQYEAPFTGRRYMVHLLPARAHVERDDQGNLLVAHVYRSGKEPFEEEFEDSIETNLLARAMLQGYAELRADGRWYVNDEPNPRVKVVFHYNTRDLSRIMTPSEIEARSADVTTLIEKMNADKEFLAYWGEQEAKNKKVATGAIKRAAQQAARPKKRRGAKKPS